MPGLASPQVARAAAMAAGGGFAAAAFLHGNQLLGAEYGVVNAAVAATLLWLLARSRMSTGRDRGLRAGAVLAFALSVGFAMAFPASLNPDVRVFIDQQATDRQARAELVMVFASDPAYRGLSVSSDHVKVVTVTVHGSLGGRPDLDRLRSRLAGECPALGRCLLRWDVTLRDGSGRVDGLDRELFPRNR